MKSILLVSTLILLQCIPMYFIDPDSVDPVKYSTVEKINAGLIDTSSVDTVEWSFNYDKYLKELKPINRSFEIIDKILQNNTEDILASIYSYAEKLNIKEVDSVSFGISQDGALVISSINSKVLKDTSSLSSIREQLSKVHFDESKEGKYNCLFSVELNDRNSPKHLKLRPQINYCELRSKASIMEIVMKYLPNMRDAYNRRLKSKPGVYGKITIKFGIDKYGKVFYVHNEASTLADELLDSAVVQQIRNWKFTPIMAKRDTTEVVYPFIFSQGQ